jgi:PAS domain S-box-containing protein
LILDPKDLLDRLDESVTVYDREAHLIYMNAAAVRPFRRPLEELLGKRPWDLGPPRPRTPFRDALEGVLAGGEKATAVSYVAAVERWFEVDVYPHPVGALVLARDITARRKADDDVRASESRFRAMVEFAPDAIVIYDGGSRTFVDSNGEAERVFGRARDKIIGATPLELSAPKQAGGVPAEKLALLYVDRMLAHGAADFEWTLVDASGRPVMVEIRARRLPSTDPPRFCMTLVDITARKRAQEQLVQVQRLEAVARLAGGIAHDFNNLLTIILGAAQLALADLGPNEPARSDIAAVIDAGERAVLVTRQLLAFARKQEVRPRLLDLSSYVERMREVLERLVGEDVEVVLDLARPLGSVLVDPAHVEQIVLNLAANARDAMPKGGRLTIATANVLLGQDCQRLHDGVPPGRYVTLTVSDTGEGIPEALKPHIFEPFFTTKALSQGTGLGLATVHGIVQQNRGHVGVYSEPGMGASFKIYLPIAEDDPVRTEPRQAAAPEPGGTETLLLVEDEDGVRHYLRRALQRGGYTVLEARNAGEALLIFEQHAERIALMVTDVIMPRMTGPELGARLRSIRADLRLVYVSGYSEDRIDATSASRHDAFLSKPVSVDDLLRAVRDVLDR